MVATLAHKFQVIPGSGARLEARLVGPQAVRPSRTYGLVLEYSNLGDVDLPAPVMLVETVGEGRLHLKGDLARHGSVLNLFCTGPNGLGLIAPGKSGEIPLRLEIGPTGTEVRLLGAIWSGTEIAFPWERIESAVLAEGYEGVIGNRNGASLKPQSDNPGWRS